MMESNHLNLEESLENLNLEESRLNTFNNDWPHAYISPQILAETGLYFIGPYDQVKCNFCKVEISCWEIGDDVLNEHMSWSTNCPLLRGQKTSNIPIKKDLNFKQSSLQNDSAMNNKVRIDRRINAYVETPFPLIHEKATNDIVQELRKPDFPSYSSKEKRLETFVEWPESTHQSPETLSEAGFFYTQKDDRVICFSCGGGIFKWEKEDDPWEQHALWYAECIYLRQNRKVNFIMATKQNLKIL